MTKSIFICYSLLAFIISLPRECLSTESVEKAFDLHEQVTLEKVIETALENSPLLAATRTEVSIRTAEVKQAGLIPNPELSYEFENFGGEQEFAALRSREQTLSLSQTIELGGKRGKRSKLAKAELNSAELEYRAAAQELVSSVKIAFYSLLAAQVQDSLARVKVHLAHEVYRTIGKRVEAGKTSPVEMSRAEIVLSMADIESGRAAAELVSARQNLASVCGFTELLGEPATGEFEIIEEPDKLENLLSQLDSSPGILIARQLQSASRAAVKLARAHRIPDLELKGGVRDARESDSRGFVAEIGFPAAIIRSQPGRD